MKCCDLSAGKLRHTVTFQRGLVVADGAGGNALTWSNVLTAKANVKPYSGSERLSAQRIESDVTHKIYIRYTGALLPSDRVVFGARLMQIKAIINMDEMNRWLEITAVEQEPT